ncbi:Type IV fimbrial assembly, ATPase PilB [Chitinispirillum alkaliphilum]|nr:Type IV fimbrial assembly, ATPase PilB [Chitinispirillum alkaliphilum]
MSTTTLTQNQLTKIALLQYDTDFSHLEKFIRSAESKYNITIKKQILSIADQLHCDIALVFFDLKGELTSFKRDIARLKFDKKVEKVIILTEASQKEVIERNISELPCDEVHYLPMHTDQFGKIIATHITSAMIADHKSKGDFNNGSMSIGEILVHNKVINPSELKKALKVQKTKGSRLGDILVELGFIDDDQKIKFLSSQLDTPLATPKQYSAADLNIVSLVPEHIAKMHKCIALEKENGKLTVAMVDVLDLQLLDNLRDITDLQINPILGKQDDIETSIKRYYQDISSHKDASELMADLDSSVEYVANKQEEINLQEMEAAGAELGIIKLVNIIITNAIRDRASDIHLEPMEKELIIRYRIDGNLRKVMSPPHHSHQAIITRIKILSNLDIAERRLPQDGQMTIKLAQREVDVRVSVLPTLFGEKAVLRILDKESFNKSISNLGFTPRNEKIFKEQINKPYGMVIVTGPTGSGKSTTLYSALQCTKSVARNIITVEDPVEYHMDGINQVNVNSKIGLTFASALRSILRQDPDIVLVGEIRDEETADIAIKMALTGHLVFSTLHTNDAASSVARFVDIGIPPLLLGSSLNLIIAQRLVRRICTKCKYSYKPDPELLDTLNISPQPALSLYKGDGCVVCNGSGYMSRIGIFEMLKVSKDIRKLILRNASTMEIQTLAQKEGMQSLRKAGLELAFGGQTTIEEVIAATTDI